MANINRSFDDFVKDYIRTFDSDLSPQISGDLIDRSDKENISALFVMKHFSETYETTDQSNIQFGQYMDRTIQEFAKLRSDNMSIDASNRQTAASVYHKMSMLRSSESKDFINELNRINARYIALMDRSIAVTDEINKTKENIFVVSAITNIANKKHEAATMFRGVFTGDRERKITDKDFGIDIKLEKRKLSQLDKTLKKIRNECVQIEKQADKMRKMLDIEIARNGNKKDTQHFEPYERFVPSTPMEQQKQNVAQEVRDNIKQTQSIQTQNEKSQGKHLVTPPINQMSVEDFNKEINDIINNASSNTKEAFEKIAELCAREQRRAVIQCPNVNTMRIHSTNSRSTLTYVVQPAFDHNGKVCNVNFRTVQAARENEFTLGEPGDKTNSFKLGIQPNGRVQKSDMKAIQLYFPKEIVTTEITEQISDNLNKHPITMEFKKFDQNMEPITPIRNMIANIYRNHEIDKDSILIYAAGHNFEICNEQGKYNLYVDGHLTNTEMEPTKFASDLEQYDVEISQIGSIEANGIELTTSGTIKEDMQQEEEPAWKVDEELSYQEDAIDPMDDQLLQDAFEQDEPGFSYDEI